MDEAKKKHGLEGLARLVFGDLTPEQVEALDRSKSGEWSGLWPGKEYGKPFPEPEVVKVKDNVVVTMDDKANADHAEAMRKAIEKIRSEFGGR